MDPNIPPPPKRKTPPKRITRPTPGKKKGPPSRKNRGPPERRTPPTMNPQDDSHIFSPTISIEEARKRDQARKIIHASKQHSMPLISLEEAQNKDQKRQMEYFVNDKINYNPDRSFPKRELDGARLANKRPHRVNTRKKKKKTSLKSLLLRNRPPGMDGGRKTRRKKRRKTRRKKRRKTRRKNKKSKRKTKRKR